MTKINSIFIVDDDPITVFGMQKMLDRTANCNSINTFKNGKIAIENIHNLILETKEIPEIIFLDINMPIMDGWQFLEEFIKLPIISTVRINIFTSSIDIVDKKNWEVFKNKTHHDVTYNQKPLRMNKIAELIQIGSIKEG